MGTVTSDGKLAYDFDGTDDYIDCGNILAGTTGGQDEAVTYSSWMKLDSYSNNNNGHGTAWLGKCDGVQAGGPLINSVNGVIAFDRFPDNSGGGDFLNSRSATSQVPLSTWKHVAVTYSGCEATGCTSIYIDGVAVSITESISNYGSGMGTNTNNFKIGTTLDQMQYKRMMNGQFDDIRVYDRVLTQSEITHLATSRGIEGPPPVGLGDEQLWLCPSLNDSANDISGNGNNGTYSGGMGTVADTSAGGAFAYDFDGVDDCISTGLGLLDNKQSFSVSAWFKSDTASNEDVIVSEYVGSGNRTFLLDLRNSGNVLGYTLTTGTDSLAQTSSSPITIGVWYHIAYTFDSGDASVFVDGVLAVSDSGAGTVSATSAANFMIGSRDVSAPVRSFFDGLLDDIRVFNRALTQSEITHLATSRGIEGSPSTCGLITDMAYWSDFDDAASSMADENGGSDTLDATVSPAVISSGSPRSSDCTNVVNAYYSLNSGANQPAPPSDYSFSIWARCTGTGSTGAWIAGQRQSTAMAGWNVFRRSSNGLVVFMELAGGVAARVVEVTPMSLNTWYLLSFSRTDAGLYGYVNGSLVGSDTTATTQGTEVAPMRIGGASWHPSNAATKYNGYLWSCGMWDRELTAAEHLQLYAGGQGLLYSEICPTPPTTQYNAFTTHAFTQLFQQRLR